MKREDEASESVKLLLQLAFPPVDPQPQRDLWPAMLHRMAAAPVGLPWFDWALLALLSGWAIAVPQGILQLLYQF